MSTSVETQTSSRPWLTWLMLGIWAFGAVLIIQNAVASGQELEPKAAMILWVMFLVWVLLAVAVWVVRRQRQRRLRLREESLLD